MFKGTITKTAALVLLSFSTVHIYALDPQIIANFMVARNFGVIHLKPVLEKVLLYNKENLRPQSLEKALISINQLPEHPIPIEQEAYFYNDGKITYTVMYKLEDLTPIIQWYFYKNDEVGGLVCTGFNPCVFSDA